MVVRSVFSYGLGSRVYILFYPKTYSAYTSSGLLTTHFPGGSGTFFFQRDWGNRQWHHFNVSVSWVSQTQLSAIFQNICTFVLLLQHSQLNHVTLEQRSAILLNFTGAPGSEFCTFSIFFIISVDNLLDINISRNRLSILHNVYHWSLIRVMLRIHI